MRAICPNCGGKIHTQAKGLGHLTWANSWVLVKTGESCQWCGARLTGKVGPDGRAQLAPVVAQPSSSRYLVTSADGAAKVFDTRSEAMVHRAVIGGGDIEVI